MRPELCVVFNINANAITQIREALRLIKLLFVFQIRPLLTHSATHIHIYDSISMLQLVPVAEFVQAILAPIARMHQEYNILYIFIICVQVYGGEMMIKRALCQPENVRPVLFELCVFIITQQAIANMLQYAARQSI